MKSQELYTRGRRNPEPTNYEYEATVAEIERRPFCDIQSRQLVLREN